ncbi:MAG TPA: sarcosine oxidase subunit gamma family protein [Steroidobacteraceae bacterium]|nr:sarcosine oxidase subunit gamma family protein [Steroidobacteraceae bacterium]
MHTDPTSLAQSAYAGLPAAAGHGSGVVATERDGLGIARIETRGGQTAAVVELLRGKLGIVPPNASRYVRCGDVAIGGLGPNTWIAVHESAGYSFAESLQALIGHGASVVDQSDAYAVLRLAGPKVRETLAKLVPIDVHPRTFHAGAIAQTVCGYLGVMLWRLEDGAQGDPAFEIWGGRSFAASLHEAIRHSAAEFGYARQTP